MVRFSENQWQKRDPFSLSHSGSEKPLSSSADPGLRSMLKQIEDENVGPYPGTEIFIRIKESTKPRQPVMPPN